VSQVRLKKFSPALPERNHAVAKHGRYECHADAAFRGAPHTAEHRIELDHVLRLGRRQADFLGHNSSTRTVAPCER